VKKKPSTGVTYIRRTACARCGCAYTYRVRVTNGRHGKQISGGRCRCSVTTRPMHRSTPYESPTAGIIWQGTRKTAIKRYRNWKRGAYRLLDENGQRIIFEVTKPIDPAKKRRRKIGKDFHRPTKK
jgi:hypothetical protein